MAKPCLCGFAYCATLKGSSMGTNQLVALAMVAVASFANGTPQATDLTAVEAGVMPLQAYPGESVRSDNVNVYVFSRRRPCAAGCCEKGTPDRSTAKALWCVAVSFFQMHLHGCWYKATVEICSQHLRDVQITARSSGMSEYTIC